MSKEVKFGFIEDDNNKIKFVKIPKKYHKYVEGREQAWFENMQKLEKDLEFKKECEIKAITLQATELLQKKEREFKSKLALTEKALELACEKLYLAMENPMSELYYYTADEMPDYFKTKAKEIMKSE